MVQQANIVKAHKVLTGEVELRFTSVIHGKENNVVLDWYFLDDAMEYVERNASVDVNGTPEVRQAGRVEGLPLSERMIVKRYVYSPVTKTWRQTIRQDY